VPGTADGAGPLGVEVVPQPWSTQRGRVEGGGEYEDVVSSVSKRGRSVMRGAASG
jgi:hypothetical protein